MLATILGAIGLVQVSVVSPPKPKLLRRSSKWDEVARKHLNGHPMCAACGLRVWDGTRYITDAAVHHILPFHLFPIMELEDDNLITLCESKSHNCHLWLGHLGSWLSWNTDVIREAAYFQTKIKTRPMFVARS